MEGNKIFAYMRISTNKKSQGTDRQKYILLKYADENNFTIDEFVSDIVSGEIKANNRENYSFMKKCLRSGAVVIVTDIDRLGRNADDVLMEIKDLQSKKVRVIILDIPYMNDWNIIYDESIYKMVIDIFITIKAHIAQQEKEKTHDRVMQGLNTARAKGKKLGRPATGVPKEFIKEYEKFQSGEYGRISIVQFSRMQGIATSTFYKYASLIRSESGNRKQQHYIYRRNTFTRRKSMLKSKLQEMLLGEYQNGFSDGRKMMEQDMIEAARDGRPIDIDGELFVVVDVMHNLRKLS